MHKHITKYYICVNKDNPTSHEYFFYWGETENKMILDSTEYYKENANGE